MTSDRAACPRCGKERFVHSDRADSPCVDCRTLPVPAFDPDAVHWKDSGVCAQTDPEEFFDDTSKSTVAAKRVCQACPVRDLCLEYALANNEPFGVWGGLSAYERRQLVAA